MKTWLLVTLSLGLAIVSSRSFTQDAPKKDQPITGPVSYYKHIRPIFQANCQGCHQPAKAKGGYVMTDFAKMLAGGDSREKNKIAIVPKNPSSSFLIEQITPVKGESEMPKGKASLADFEIALITRWINEGAIDDTPANVRQRYDAEHPPQYTLPPVITSLDYSPDGKFLAVAGFHEVILHRADGSGIAARLVGLSERIESVKFSPDGRQIAVAGGQPGRMGEVQVWDVDASKLKVSVPITYDTVYGVSWSPDGKLIAFGCADNTVRAIEAATGKQVLQQGSHNDWVLDTVWSLKGDNVISVGRDMTAKLTELATQRFVDNITSITPGALRGGLHSVARHPTSDFILVGGSDGSPQIYRIFREIERKIGDNANLIRKFPDMPGRIFSVKYSKDGKQFAASSSLDNTGEVVIYNAEIDTSLPDNIKKILRKEVGGQSASEKEEIEKFHTKDIKLIAKTDFPTTGVYAVAFSPDGSTLATAGQDGIIRLLQTADGKIAKEFPAATVTKDIAASAKLSIASAAYPTQPLDATTETLPKDAIVVALDVQPSSVKLSRPTECVQFLVTAKLASGETADVTRLVHFKMLAGIAEITPRGNLSPTRNGSAELEVSMGQLQNKIPVDISGIADNYKIDFIHDVTPVLSKAGCNAGTCHGSKEGKNGFKLSLRGYDPIMDVRAFGDDLASRRVNAASPDDSLMLLKPTAGVPHEGGQKLKLDEKYYQIIRGWIADGAKLDAGSPRVARIEIFPKDPVIQAIGSKQQMRVVATYTNNETRDVTAESFIDSGNMDVATTDGAGLVLTLRRGEAPILARYEGSYAATTVTVMGDRSGFVWQDPPSYGRVDELVAAKWKRMKIQPSDVCNDAQFIRRVYLDLTGLPPSAQEVVAFMNDPREPKLKREEVVDKLIGSPEYVDHWSSKWADLLQVNRKYLGVEGAQLFRDWIRKQIDTNVPYDQFVRSILTASGSNKDNPPASFFKIMREPAETMESTTHLFLATRFNCNKCHDHPFERWTQDQYYQTSAYFSQVELKADPASNGRKIGGTAVDDAKALFEIVADKKDGEVKHLRTGKVAPPTFPFPAKYDAKEPQKMTRREHLAAWLTSADNRYFAMSYVNRIWGYMLGVGIIEPLDDIRAGNPATNPELLEYLTKEFIQHNFDVRHVMRLICKSRTYQLAITPNQWNEDDKTNYSHALARRLPAEVLLDSVFKVTGSMPNFPGLKPGTRAAQLPDSGVDLPSGFLANLGRPPRESVCECERSNDIRLGSVMSLLSGPAVSDAIADPKNDIGKLVASEPDDKKMIDGIFLGTLNRHATDNEIAAAIRTMGLIDADNSRLKASLDEMEKKYAPVIADQEKQRLALIEKTKTELAEYEKAIAPKIAEDERKQKEKIAADEKAIQDYEPSLKTKLEEWEKALTAERRGTIWTALDSKMLKASNSVKIKKLSDGTVLLTGPTPNTEYSFTADVAMTNITGVKLEVLPDETLPKFGPGRADDGNFVLTSIKVEWAPKGGEKDKMSAVKLVDAIADFTQKDFDVKQTITGKTDGQKGWAIAGTPPGHPHEATFKLEKPIGDEKGTVLKITLYHNYGDKYSIGRFRLRVTTSDHPLEFGIPAEVAPIVNISANARTPEQNAALGAWYRTTDPELLKKQQALAKDKQALPIDPKLTTLKDAIKKAEEPIRIEPKLIQLRQDVAASEQQIKNIRLTGAQDLVWALINNPAFLFNH